MEVDNTGFRMVSSWILVETWVYFKAVAICYREIVTLAWGSKDRAWVERKVPRSKGE